ncbi:hypothetical protein Cgig2_007505 [Carnegiea gigantea]|uniref:Uncharacterized protein n=1 Tax=Carnegiea gigantea TaxID=171969 RepID=A0A9Q1Q7F0_9CARY|nr:hypothetical protein Cgig2_007505 [Carnegiea gigantea]
MATHSGQARRHTQQQQHRPGLLPKRLEQHHNQKQVLLVSNLAPPPIRKQSPIEDVSGPHATVEANGPCDDEPSARQHNASRPHGSEFMGGLPGSSNLADRGSTGPIAPSPEKRAQNRNDFNSSGLQNSLFIHPSDGPSSLTIEDKLIGYKNCITWHRSMAIKLSIKRKLFLNKLDDEYNAQSSQILLVTSLPCVKQEKMQSELLTDVKPQTELSALLNKKYEVRCDNFGNKGQKDRCWELNGYTK